MVSVPSPQADDVTNEERQLSASGLAAITQLVGSDAVANLTAIIQQVVREEVLKLLQRFPLEAINLNSGASDEQEKPYQVVIKQETTSDQQPGQQSVEPKPVYFLPRRQGYFPVPHPFYYASQQPIPFYNSPESYMYRGDGRFGGPQWRRLNPTDESLSELEALAELELLLNEKSSISGDAEARGLKSSISSTTNSAKASFKSFVNSLSSALPSFSIVKKTYLVPGLAISG